MKNLFILLLIFPVVIYGQNQQSLKLILSFSDCRNDINKIGIHYADTIRFFQNIKLTNEIVRIRNNQSSLAITDFKSGTYTVYFHNLYGEKISKLITIPNTTGEYSLLICVDSLITYSYNSLTKLRKGETIKISFWSSGCFHQIHETLIITKGLNGFLGKLTNGSETKSAVLSQSAIIAFTRFENEIRGLEEKKGCTTIDQYIVSSKDSELKKVDGGCTWRGFYFLKKAIFTK